MVEENKMIIVPDTQKENIPEGIQGRLGYTYLHGKLEEDCKFDCYNVIGFEKFGFKKENDSAYIIVEESMRGIYPCIYNNKDCSLYIWYRKGGIPAYRGLVVYNDDEESILDVLEKYNTNVNHI